MGLVLLFSCQPCDLGQVLRQSLSSDIRDNKSTVIPQFLQETGHRALTDAHVHECLSPFLLRQVFGCSLSTFSWVLAVVCRLLTTWLLCCIVQDIITRSKACTLQCRCISFLRMVDLRVVETTAAEPTDTQNRVYLPKQADQKLNQPLSHP